MSTITYTLAVVDGRVCYECLPSTKGAFYHCGAWYKPFCNTEEMKQSFGR
jgi:hypothetical protein